MDSSDSEEERLVLECEEDTELEGTSNRVHEEELRPQVGPILPYMYEPEVVGVPARAGEEPNVAPARDVPDQGYRLRTLNWCTCGHCVVMPTARECICCQEIAPVNQRRMRDNPPPICITLKRGFQSVCLDVDVLETAYYHFRQQYGDEVNLDQINEKCRYFAYRQLVRWCWGYLGRDVRVILPACTVSKIREEFSAGGNYVGFKLPGE